jgi:hypothetical protein
MTTKNHKAKIDKATRELVVATREWERSLSPAAAERMESAQKRIEELQRAAAQLA